jgi:hypothetical protein
MKGKETYFPLVIYEEIDEEKVDQVVNGLQSQAVLCLKRAAFVNQYHVVECSTCQILITRNAHKVCDKIYQ